MESQDVVRNHRLPHERIGTGARSVFPRCGIVRIYGGALAVSALTKEVGLPHIWLALHSHAAGQMDGAIAIRQAGASFTSYAAQMPDSIAP
ncbi:hypothetical protein GsuE55_31700 [Geobacillus subterraneus]|uniref:Uncharacterized protein n=1 Tax=Geobacillus subterraneus TaxID=129338 RepID=A0A679FVW2_9BACL|nr:hypothetical protein GsuE55_31700 [Geobacillus subterraneus]